MNDLWPHQHKGLIDVLACVQAGERRILLTSPTGGGKTRLMLELAQNYLARGKKVILYTNRRMLVDQTSKTLMKSGLDHGIRAAGYADERDLHFQISSIQTEASRVLKKGTWGLHDADLVLVDEAHCQTAKTAKRLMDAHYQEGAVICGFTATPIGLGGLYDVLCVAGIVSELRGCGALLPCRHYGPDEPDLRSLQGLREGEDLSEEQQRTAMGPRPQLWGRVWEWFERLNPDRRPTILFAPGVEESIWFAEQFSAKGVPAAHIDGQNVWVDGELHRTSRDLRQKVLDDSHNGRIQVLCNRFVLREGVDCPWLAHGILATVFGSLQSYLQSGGRLLRSHPGYSSVTVQDHGGNWWRHGSLNADRHWRLEDTAASVAGLRAEGFRSKNCRRCHKVMDRPPICKECGFLNEPEPYRCPQCGAIVGQGRCHSCGWVPQGKRSRPVVTAQGELIELEGRIFKPRQVCTRPDGPQIWERMWHRSRTAKGSRTFAAAIALFAMENNWKWPDRSWPFMPVHAPDLYHLVKDVPISRLTQGYLNRAQTS